MSWARNIVIVTAMVLLMPRYVLADNLILVRTKHSFPEAMLALQESIKNYGYTVSRVQRVDIGLTKSGYKTEKYRVVFFGKNDETLNAANSNKDLIAYLPLKISIYAEDKETIIVTLNPLVLKQFFPDKKLAPVFERWAKDVNDIISATLKSED